MDQFFYEIIIESTISILEIIQEKGLEIHLYRLMEDDMALIAFQRTMPSGTNLFLQSQVRPQPYLAVDLQGLFIDFFQMLTCVEETQHMYSVQRKRLQWTKIKSSQLIINDELNLRGGGV